MTAVVPDRYRALIGSGRVSARTRAALLERAAPVEAGVGPAVLSEAELAVLRAVVDRVVPQGGGPTIDLAARIDRALAAGAGDGWRFAGLPADASAYRTGLAALDAAGFGAMDAAGRDELLGRLGAGEMALGGWSGEQGQRWFEDVRSDAVRLYVAHPATLARMGYSGIGYGGDEELKPGFVGLEPGATEAWEPAPARGDEP